MNKWVNPPRIVSDGPVYDPKLMEEFKRLVWTQGWKHTKRARELVREIGLDAWVYMLDENAYSMFRQYDTFEGPSLYDLIDWTDIPEKIRADIIKELLSCQHMKQGRVVDPFRFEDLFISAVMRKQYLIADVFYGYEPTSESHEIWRKKIREYLFRFHNVAGVEYFRDELTYDDFDAYCGYTSHLDLEREKQVLDIFVGEKRFDLNHAIVNLSHWQWMAMHRGRKRTTQMTMYMMQRHGTWFDTEKFKVARDGTPMINCMSDDMVKLTRLVDVIQNVAIPMKRDQSVFATLSDDLIRELITYLI